MSYRKWFIWLNFGLLAAFAWAYVKDYQAEWKPYQSRYYQMAADELDKKAASANPDEATSLKAEAAAWRSSPLQVRQIIAKDLGRVDRCTTCHVGMDEFTNPSLKNNFTQNPYKAHPQVEVFAKNHPFQKYGCTICHNGQGLATTVSAAHGKVENWEQPMYEGKMVQASCARCHQDFEHLPGAEFAAAGKKLFNEHGCRGCHSIRTVGGVVSVDLGDIADKPIERIAGFNFSQIQKDGKPLSREDWTLPNWILGHLTNDPMKVIPNDPLAKFNAEPVAPTGMPNFTEPDATGKREITEENAHQIATWLLSNTAAELPYRYVVFETPKAEPHFEGAAAHGKFVFEKYGCAGCHGLHGTKGRRNYNALGPGQKDPSADMDKGREPTLVDVVGTYTHEELVKKISNGVPASAINKFNPNGPTPPLYMPAWKDKIKPAELDDLATYLLSIAKKQEVGF
jgi:cytochrome c2